MKNKTAILIVVIFLMAGCARVPWTKADKAMFGAAVVAGGYDYYTTNRALDRGHGISSEYQWLYGGDNPSSSTLAASKAAQMGIAWLVLDRTPSRWRKVVMIIMTGGWVYYGSQNN